MFFSGKTGVINPFSFTYKIFCLAVIKDISCINFICILFCRNTICEGTKAFEIGLINFMNIRLFNLFESYCVNPDASYRKHFQFKKYHSYLLYLIFDLGMSFCFALRLSAES